MTYLVSDDLNNLASYLYSFSFQIYLESTLLMTCIVHLAYVHRTSDFCFDMHPLGYHVPTEVSLGFVAVTLGAGVLLSIGKNQIE